MNKVLEGVNSTLEAVNSVLGGSPSGTYIDSTAQSSITAAINKASSNSDAKKLFNDARPAIEKVIGLIACGADYQKMAAYSDDGTHSFIPPSVNISHHKSGCLKVLRINNIKKKTANSVGFTVTYMSPQSEEATTRYYLAVKQPSGEWLFQWLLMPY